VQATAHITGGGFHDNILRVLPEGVRAVLGSGLRPVPPDFEVIQGLRVAPRRALLGGSQRTGVRPGLAAFPAVSGLRFPGATDTRQHLHR